MVHLKTPRELEKIRASCRIAAEALVKVAEIVAPGVTTLKLDQVAETYIRKRGGVPSAKNYKGYPGSICISVNDEVVHGIPGKRVLHEGDLLAVDIAVRKEGFHGDMNVSLIVGEGSPEARRLLEVTRQAMEVGIQAALVGKRMGDVGHAIQSYVEGQGFSIVRDFCGHGIGKAFHEEPQLLHFGRPHTGWKIEPGAVFTVEPMVNQGGPEVRVLEDNWTAVTLDGALSAQFEHTVAVLPEGPRVLSRFEDLPF
jgi:methionyl aminopeptidase